ncbi:MAG: lytic murein transglycosylase [Candidatus Yanofskybacteria bacterium]|nr:lytic murein transglycosylase [Candidatus Yanofskybacteria bacterium]
MGVILTAVKLIFFHFIPIAVAFMPTLISKSPDILPSISPTVAPSVAPPVIASPITDSRLAYVQRQLIASGFQEAQVNQLLGDSRKELYPPQRVSYKEPNWTPVKDKLYSSAYVQQGKNFISANQAVFESAQQEFDVPKEVITAIIAIETEFGRNTGNTPTFNAVYSRLQQRPTDNWRGEAERLIALSKYCLQSDLNCYAIKGSYAGAIGIVQFMPDSLMRFGIDGDKDGIVDLHKPADAIPSAANFLKAHGWQEDQSRAITRYYGNPVGYPEIVLHYASLISK